MVAGKSRHHHQDKKSAQNERTQQLSIHKVLLLFGVTVPVIMRSRHAACNDTQNNTDSAKHNSGGLTREHTAHNDRSAPLDRAQAKGVNVATEPIPEPPAIGGGKDQRSAGTRRDGRKPSLPVASRKR